MSEWEQRMELLRPWLGKFQRRFSVLDLGCGDGQISRQIAREYDTVVVVVDKGLGESEEYSVNHYHDSPRTICLRHEMDVAALNALADCEHFDVVLALNFLHHFGKQWSEATDAVLRMGWHVFIQLPRTGVPDAPGHEIMPELHRKITDANGIPLGETVQYPGHLPRPLWMIANPVSKMLPKTTLMDALGKPQVNSGAPVEVLSTHTDILQRRGKGASWKPWIVGMNLWNLLHLGIVWPTREALAAQVRAVQLLATQHGDVAPWNMIYDGERLYLIDHMDNPARDDKFGLEHTEAVVRMEHPVWA